MDERILMAAGAMGLGALGWWLFRRRTLIGVVIVAGDGDLASYPDWRGYLRTMAPDFVSVKICDGTQAYRPSTQSALIAALRADGHTVHGWGWAYADSRDKAIGEADTALALCGSLGLANYHWNAEKYWSGTVNPSVDTAGNAEAFISRWRQKGGPLVWANASSKGAARAPQQIAKFDFWEPMCYGGSAHETAKAQFEHPGGRYQAYRGRRGRAVMISTGRLTDSGSPMGRWHDSVTGQPGYLTLLRRHKPHAVSFYRAPLNFDGNRYNPPLARQAAELRGQVQPNEVA